MERLGFRGRDGLIVTISAPPKHDCSPPQPASSRILERTLPLLPIYFHPVRESGLEGVLWLPLKIILLLAVFSNLALLVLRPKILATNECEL